MRDRVLLYAIGISVVLHLVAVGVVGRTSASRLNNNTATAPVQRLVKVDFVGDPDEAVKKPEPVIMNRPQPEKIIPPENTPTFNPHNPYVSQPNYVTAHSIKSNRVPGNPGGKLNVGSASRNGDIGGDWSGGRTPVGYVPGNDRGTGIGSGNGPGVGHSEPDRNASDGPRTTPAPPPPPEPKTVNVRVCNESGLIPGENCKHSHSESFVDGREPGRTCNQCKAPEPEFKSRLADHAKPKRIRDWNVSLPSSVEEGSYTVVVGYTVTKEGNVTGAKIISSSGNRAVDRAVVKAAPDMKYEPAVQDGVPLNVTMTRECTFN